MIEHLPNMYKALDLISASKKKKTKRKKEDQKTN
jgi:hypothetical protein